jgi:hypothetical protein
MKMKYLKHFENFYLPPEFDEDQIEDDELIEDEEECCDEEGNREIVEVTEKKKGDEKKDDKSDAKDKSKPESDEDEEEEKKKDDKKDDKSDSGLSAAQKKLPEGLRKAIAKKKKKK